MVKNVGIMSMQRILNYGSSLQAYGLKRLIEAVDDEARVRFVDYRPGPVLVGDIEGSGPQSTSGRISSKLREFRAVDGPLPERVRRITHLAQHVRHKRRYASRNFRQVGVLREFDYDLDLELQVIGSDEVFNCLQSNPAVGYSRDLFGHGSPAQRIVSYAASFGNTTLNKIEEAGIADELAADLARFESISVRDKNSATIVEALTGRIATISVDPVLAHDFMALEPGIPTHRMHSRKYLLVYGYSGRFSESENDELRRIADMRGLEILSLGGTQPCADRFIDCTPLELLAYFRDAEAVVTDTFHGTIFSLINGRPFATIVRPSSGNGYGNEEKLTYLLETFDLQERNATQPAELEAILDCPLDHAELGVALERERHDVRTYLQRILTKVPRP